MTFTNLHPSNVSTANLASYDTVILNVASYELNYNVPYYRGGVKNLSAQAKADLVTFVDSGHKLIIYDSEMQSQDYSWLPYPFVTNNPGAMGATGTLNIVEDNTLSHTDSSSPYYIDAYAVAHYTDAVGDSNVLTTIDPNWMLDMSATNYNNVTGPVHVYADYDTDNSDVGLIIYNGLDVDYITSGNTGAVNLREIYVQELQQPFNPDGLPGSISVVGVNLAPSTNSASVGQSHTVVATLTDQLGQPQSGVEISFEVSGVNVGAEGDSTSTYSPASRLSDSNGKVSFTYVGDGGVGTDTIVASFVSANGQTIKSQVVTAEWTNASPTVTLNGPVSANEGEKESYEFTTSDPDVGETFSIVLTSGGSVGTVSNLVFDSSTGAGSFDVTFSDGPATSTVSVQVKDSHDAPSNESSINVEVANVAPTVDAAGPFSVAENSAEGTPVGSVTASDPGDDTITGFTITGGTGQTAFAVDSSGNITVADSSQLDYETTTSFTLEIAATDSDDATGASTTVTINLLDEANVSGFVFADVDGDGEFDVEDAPVAGVTITLTESDFTVRTATTDNDGFYIFEDVAAGTTVIAETQPADLADGIDSLPATYTDLDAVNDQFTVDFQHGVNLENANFAELADTGGLNAGDTATIGFWQNKNGQKLLDDLDADGELTAWLLDNFGNIFDQADFDAHDGDVGQFYKEEFFKLKLEGSPKVDAQFMAVAFATFATSSNLSNGAAAAYGFNITETGIGTTVLNVGDSGEAFGVDDGADMTIMAMLLATNTYTGAGADLLYDGAQDVVGDDGIADGNGGDQGDIDAYEMFLRKLANDVYTAINEGGDI